MIGFLDSFIGYATLERGLAENTVAAYAHDIRDFLDFLAENGLDDLDWIERDDVLDYLERGVDAGLEPSTCARRLIAIKVFFRHLQREKLIARNVIEVMEGPRLSRLLPDFLTAGEVTRLLAAFPGKDPLYRRNRTILEVFYATGMRVGELAALCLDWLRLDDEVVRVIGKGNKERIIPIGRPARRELQRYLVEVRPLLDKRRDAAQVFLSVNGRPLTRARIWAIVKEAAARVGLDKNVYPHMLRHSFASHLLGGGADLRVIQEMLGHADIATTQIYTHIDQNRLLSTHRKFHPRG